MESWKSLKNLIIRVGGLEISENLVNWKLD